MFEITENARIAAGKIAKTPNIVLCIDGVDTCYGSSIIFKLIRYGDPGLVYGGGEFYGGATELEDQETLISIDQSTNSIKQQLDIDKFRGSSISSMEIALTDIGRSATKLISPGVIVEDLLGRSCKVRLGFAELTNWPEDYFIIFRGIIDDINAAQGVVKLNIAHPDQKKRSSIYQSIQHALDGDIDDTQTTITLDSTSSLLTKVLGPDGTYDSSFGSYIRVDDEVIYFDAISGNDLTGCIRGQFGTLAAAHDDETDVNSIYELSGNAIDLSLKLMLSGWQNSYVSGIEAQNYIRLGDNTPVDNAIFFFGLNIVEEYGVVVGDYVTTTGASNGANNISLKPILDVVITDEGSYIIVDDVTFVEEIGTPATVSFRSQYDTLPSGLMMAGDEVDVAQHLKLKRLFISSFDYEFRLDESIENGKEFLEKQVYGPAGCYSLPRKAQASIGYFVGPIPGAETTILNEDNIANPKELKIRRSINKNFFNTIVYKYDPSIYEPDKYLRGVVTQSATSLDRIPVGTRALVIESKGMRQILSGQNNAVITSNRRLNRFKFGSEFLESVQVTFEVGFSAEVGDILMLDPEGLNLANTADGTRSKPSKLFEVSNITKSIKTGKVTVDLIDTGFDGMGRYCLIGPSSRIKGGISSTEFIIESSFNSEFGVNEYKKWSRYQDCAVKIRSSDFTTRFAQSVIVSNTGNVITVSPGLGFTPQAGDIMELADYDFADTTDQVKLKYGFQSPLTGGDDPYIML